MLVLLPPSETKATGGTKPPFEAASTAHAGLAASRVAALDALDRLVASGQDVSTPAKARAAAANAQVRTSPTMPAIERYTGVLYDALGAGTLPSAAREWVDRHVIIGSALFGFVRADEPIPAYKVSHATRLPGVRLRELWADAAAALPDDAVLDLRSKAYAALAPVPHAVQVDVVGLDGAALNHWNKHAKGALVRALAEDSVTASSVDELVDWAGSAGVALRRGGDRLRLVAVPV